MFIFIVSFALQLGYCLASSPNCELYIENLAPNNYLYVRFYPIGAVFQKAGSSSYSPHKYSMNSKTYDPDSTHLLGATRRGESSGANRIRYIIGLDGFALQNRAGLKPGFFELQTDSTDLKNWLFLGNDASANSDIDGIFGFGKFMLEIWTDNTSSTQPIVSIPIDWLDFNYPYHDSDACQDLKLYIHSLSPLSITFSGTLQVLKQNFHFSVQAAPHIMAVFRFTNSTIVMSTVNGKAIT